MRLFFAPNTISVAVAVGLFEAGLEFEPVPVSFKEAEQTKPAYLAINPKGRVPALDVDGKILTETGALLEYIASRAPGAALMPADPLQAVKVRSVMFYLASTMHVNHAHGMRGTRWANDPASHKDMAAKVPETMAASARYLEDDVLADGPFVLGSEISIADCYMFAICNWLPGDGVDLSGYPKLSRFMDAMNARDSVQATRKIGVLV